MRETLTGHLGQFVATAEDVKDMIGVRVLPTVLLVGLGTLLATYFGVMIGIRGGWRRGSRFDTNSQYGSLILYSMPEGWLGMLLLLVFSGWLHWFPAGGYTTGGLTGVTRWVDILDHLFLPLLTLTLGYIGGYAIVMRSAMIDTTHEDFVQTARAKGVPERQVRKRHVVPNAFLPAFTLIFLSFGYVLGGAIVIESVFSWPGLGRLTYDAINSLDYPVIQAVFLIIERRGDPGEPGGRPHLRLPRPADQERLTWVRPPPPSARVTAWTRRRATLAGHWRTLRSNRRGMIGLTILAFFGAIAIASPLLVSEQDLDRGARDRSAARAAPGRLPARHRQLRPFGARPADRRRARVVAGRHHRGDWARC